MSHHTLEILFFGFLLVLFCLGLFGKTRDLELAVHGSTATFRTPRATSIYAFMLAVFFFGWMLIDLIALPIQTVEDALVMILGFLFPLGFGLLLLHGSCISEMEIDLQSRTYCHTTRWIFGPPETKTGSLDDFEGVCYNGSREVMLLLRHREGVHFGYLVGRYRNHWTAAPAGERIAATLLLPLVPAPWDRRPWDNR